MNVFILFVLESNTDEMNVFFKENLKSIWISIEWLKISASWQYMTGSDLFRRLNFS